MFSSAAWFEWKHHTYTTDLIQPSEQFNGQTYIPHVSIIKSLLM